MEIIPPHTTLVGVRFHPGMAPPLRTVLDELVDERVALDEIWGHAANRLGEAMASAAGPEAALSLLQAHLLGGDTGTCDCGHDHSASYRPFLATRRYPGRLVSLRQSV